MKSAQIGRLVAIVVLAACSKAPDAGPGADAGAGAHLTVASGEPRGGVVVGWKGAYKSVESGITLPKDVKWRVPATEAGVGDGTIAITVDPVNGQVRGTLDGVLGPATLDGLAADGRLTASVLRQDPSDHGFSGTLEGDLGDAGARGTIHVALAEASAVRNATFELAPVHTSQTAR